ncbi:MAG: spore protease YyaC [Bacteroidales bacterium]|nr:spore protease YyaC [Bacteroidales bacterium]
MKLYNNSIYINTKDKTAQYEMNHVIHTMVKRINKSYKRIAVICIGTDRSTGDSYGPLVGYILSKYTIYSFDLYGTIYEPVHALTLEKTIYKIRQEDTLVLAIDSSVGLSDYVGCIGLKYGAIQPGSGVGKNLPPVGDIAISGVVALSGFAPLIMLQSASLGMVYKMAEKTAMAISYLLYKEQIETKGRTIERSAAFDEI